MQHLVLQMIRAYLPDAIAVNVKAHITRQVWAPISSTLPTGPLPTLRSQPSHRIAA